METTAFKSKTRQAGHLQTSGRQLNFNNNLTDVTTSLVKHDTKYDDLFMSKSFNVPKNKISNESLHEINAKHSESNKKEKKNFMSSSIQNFSSNYSKKERKQEKKIEEFDNDDGVDENDSDDDCFEANNNINVHPSSTQETESTRQIEFDSKYYDLYAKDAIEFITTPAPYYKDEMVRCKIFVKKALFKEYQFCLEYPNDNYFLIMQATRKKKNLSIFYWLNVWYYSNPAYLVRFGRLSSNFSRMSFVLIGDLTNRQVDSDDINLETEIKATKKYLDLDYMNKLISKPKPKDINVDILLPNNPEEHNKTKNINTVEKLFKKSGSKRMSLTTKRPIYDSVAKKYKLDFKGRALLASSNNLQLVDSNGKTLFQLGKYKKKCYNCDFTYPICAFQAFSIAIACLSRK